MEPGSRERPSISLYENLYSKRQSQFAAEKSSDLSMERPNRNSPSELSESRQYEDFYKGFYDGTVMRHESPSTVKSKIKYVATNYIAPMMANALLFMLPLVYLRYKMHGRMSDVFPFSLLKPFFPQKKQTPGNTGESVMEMFSPLKPRDFEIKLKYDGKSKVITFSDIFGVDEAKKELLIYKNFIERPAQYTRFGGKLPKGLLMVGKPGTGKTMLMKAFVNECNRHMWDGQSNLPSKESIESRMGRVALFSAVGSDFIELYGGSGPKRVRELFKQAKKRLRDLQQATTGDQGSSCAVVIFIDEIDALGCRGGGTASDGRALSGGISSEENRTINQILSELDGIESMENIVVVGATNNPEGLDKALLREGRFDKKVHLSLPDIPARTDIFEHYLGDIVTDRSNPTSGSTAKNSKKLLAAELAERTPGTSPAQISTIVNEAAITAAVKEKQYVSQELLHNAVDDVLIGKKRRNRMSRRSIERTAIHESGHCLMAWFTSPTLQTKVLKISLIPRGMAGGYTQQLEREETDVLTLNSLFSTLCVLVAGRVSEEIAYVLSTESSGEKRPLECTNAWDVKSEKNINQSSQGISTGAYDDLQRATQIAAEMIMSYGLSSIKNLVADDIWKSMDTDDLAKGESESLLSFPVQGKRSGRGWLPYSEPHHRYIEEKSKVLIDLAFRHARKLLNQENKKLFALRDALLEKQELKTNEIEEVLGPRPI
ncbi:metalloprotease [Perkinsela sp. CCAP 1560/4]|nr:metalloprotease [Perkinsela sp. CCAP 1560/4]|eukprot:KNH06107.1 metalloprotease [Perkinsela sp. CCAP 1560/4]